MTTAQRRRPEPAAFLRSRRAQVTPADVGMSPGIRRRTPAQRREEVAQLSGMGDTGYTRLGQGRPFAELWASGDVTPPGRRAGEDLPARGGG